ncbi:MAG: hypothetical protein ND807_09800 [Vicinamibacterales bacterium]|nr:hypothetical protein [Vicinamibacterales bacterium]
MTKRMVFAILALVAAASVARGQDIAMSEIKYNRGQSVQPAFEGWTRNPDGSFSMWFGYMNRNWEETPDVPPGPNNGFGATGEDLGQPTHFNPRRQEFIFKVNVPADWPKDRDLVWTVNVNGVSLKAYGSLWPVWEIDDRIMSANNGGRTARTFGEPVNRPPAISAQLPKQTIQTGQSLTLVLAVTDDGLPTPEIRRRSTGGRVVPDLSDKPLDPLSAASRGSFRVKWVQYRGAGLAKITPGESPVLTADRKATLTGGTSTTKVTFDKPGTYTLRAYAMDGDAFFATQDVEVTVTGH